MAIGATRSKTVNFLAPKAIDTERRLVAIFAADVEGLRLIAAGLAQGV